jgi:uncharacterized protein (TIGR01244 family)
MTDPEDIRGWQRLDARITTSGRIEAGDIARLAAIGVRRVVNLALDDHPEALAGEGEKLAAAGIAYTHIPIPFDAPGEAHYRAFSQALAGEPGPVHVHCIMNWRVSALFYRRNRENGMDAAAARAIMQVQWDPLASEDPRAAAWAELIAG